MGIYPTPDWPTSAKWGNNQVESSPPILWLQRQCLFYPLHWAWGEILQKLCLLLPVGVGHHERGTWQRVWEWTSTSHGKAMGLNTQNPRLYTWEVLNLGAMKEHPGVSLGFARTLRALGLFQRGESRPIIQWILEVTGALSKYVTLEQLNPLTFLHL